MPKTIFVVFILHNTHNFCFVLTSTLFHSARLRAWVLGGLAVPVFKHNISLQYGESNFWSNSLSKHPCLYNINISFQHPETPYFIIISEKEQEVAAAVVIVPTVARCAPIESPCRRRIPCLFYFRDGKLV